MCSRVIICDVECDRGGERNTRFRMRSEAFLERWTHIRMLSSFKQINLHKDGMRWKDRLVSIDPFYANRPYIDVLCFVLVDSPGRGEERIFGGQSGQLRRKFRDINEVDGRMSPCDGLRMGFRLAGLSGAWSMFVRGSPEAISFITHEHVRLSSTKVHSRQYTL